MTRINSILEVCGSAMGSALLFIISSMLVWFLGTSAGLALSGHGEASIFACANAAFMGFVLGPFPGAYLVINWTLLLIPFVIGIRTENPLLRYTLLTVILAIALASGYRAGSISFLPNC